MATSVVQSLIVGEGIVKINSRILDSSELKKLDKLEKELIHASGSTNKDIRVQLNDQLKCLDGRLETQQSLVNEFQDIFRRRAEIEANYSRDLEKLAKFVSNRHKEHRQKREGWQTFSSLQLWETVVQQTKRSSRDHAALSEIYSSQMLQRFNQINEDLTRIYRKCREIGYEIHEEVLKVLHELHTAMKTLHTYQSEFRQAENKLQEVEKQRKKLEASVPLEKRQKSKKFRLIEKEFSKRKQKYDDARLKATKARNEYLLYMDAANSSIQKYFVDDLSDLIDCMDFGFHQSLHRTIMMHSDALEHVKTTLQQDIYGLEKSLVSLDSRHDKQKFFEVNNAAFMIPKKFEYTPVRRDETETLTQKSVLEELESRKGMLHERLASLKAESEEIWKSMEMAEKSLSEVVNCRDWDTTRFFVEDDIASHKEPESIIQKEKEKRHEVEDFYVNKFREYVLNSNRIARLQAKYDHIRTTLGDQSTQTAEGMLTLTRRPNTGRRRRIGKTPRHGAPKLFGGSLEEYLEDTNVDIPPVIKSCVRVINRYGLHHHGIFRKSGAQVEINNFRDSFERGEDPLADVTDASDINSVAGVLKLYLRELREPLFPIQYFDHFMELSQLESKHDFVFKVRDLVKSWPRPIFIVMRYLFAFLNHLSEFSDENMMDPYNLAICFGPTLVPIPEERDQVQFQNLVNELIKNFIIFHEDIFPTNVPGTVYEKYLTLEPDDMGDSPVEQGQEDLDVDSEMNEDDSVFREDNDDRDVDLSIDLFGKSDHVLEAQALYDFNARSPREVNFRKGDLILLEKQVSNDWWKGSVNGKSGLIPDKYIMLKMTGEDDRAEFNRDRSASVSCEDRRRSRGSSSSEATTSNTLSGRISHPSPSPARRSSRHSTASAQLQTSPASRRISRSSVNSCASNSPGAKSASTSSVPAQPSSSTVINVPGGRPRFSSKESECPTSGRDEMSTASTRASIEDVINDEDIDEILEQDQQQQPPVVGNTHIIKVSGPVTNLDETVVSGELPNRESGYPARSRMPLSPSMEMRLRESSGSQDSLLSSGSNQELQNQLDSTIAQVDAITSEIEQQKLVKAEQVPPQKPRRLSKESSGSSSGESSTGARSRVPVRRESSQEEGATPTVTPRTTLPRATKTIPFDNRPPSGVMLKQSSWASRDAIKAEVVEDDSVESGVMLRKTSMTIGHAHEEPQEEGKTFNKARDLWERRTSFQSPSTAKRTVKPPSPTAEEDEVPAKGGFRNNRDFWEQRVTMRQKQTPDLVMDLPVNSLSTSPKHSLQGATSKASTPGATSVASVAPQPRPRKSVSSAPPEDKEEQPKPHARKSIDRSTMASRK